MAEAAAKSVGSSCLAECLLKGLLGNVLRVLTVTRDPPGDAQNLWARWSFLTGRPLEYLGKTNEELKDWALIDVVHPEDLPRVIETSKKSIEAGQIYDVERRCRR
jgi:hypothetical protein